MLSERLASRRAALVDAAVRAIQELGPSVSMAELARSAGITKPILYRHFGDKAGLCQAIAERKAEQLWDELVPKLDRAALTSRDGLRNAIDAYLAFCEREEAVHRFLLAQRGHAGRRVASSPDDAGIADGIRDRLAELGLDASAAEPWAHGVVGLVTEAAAWWLLTRRITREELCTHLMTLLWNGFAGLADADGEPGRTT
jgi:AcrR family transcriptional regulator